MGPRFRTPEHHGGARTSQCGGGIGGSFLIPPRLDYGVSVNVESGDWVSLDRWWSAHAQLPSIARVPAPTRELATEQLAECWTELGPWWRAYAETSPVAERHDRVSSFDHWNELDPWWDAYTETGRETAVRVVDLLARSDDAWGNSAAPFDTDPLAVDLAGERLPEGPLRPSAEEEWSGWLARLLGPSPALVAELFDVAIDRVPEEITPEAEFETEEEFVRHPDVLLRYADHGVSIEVELGEENYRKTAEAAGLLERRYDDLEWTHVLLFPKRKPSRLATTIEFPLDSGRDGQPRVARSDHSPVRVVHWRDVTAAIRSLLGRGGAVDDHWAADAYLFCSLVERRILGFRPAPVVEQLADPARVVDAVRPVSIAHALEEQLTYLREKVAT